MANMNIRTPRFYTDQISYLMARGTAQNGEFDVTASNTTNLFMGTFTTGSEPELFDMNPLNKCTFDTSADTDAHVLITIDTQSTTLKKSYIAILNHNLVSSVGKIRIFAGDIASDVTAVEGANADTADFAWGADTALDVVGEYNDATCDYNNDPTITHDTNSNMKAGMSVSGTGIPVGATIASVTSTTAFELSASTTGGAVTNGTLTFNTQTLIITGTNFQTGATVTIDGTAPSTVTRDSSTQITVTGTPAKTAGTKADGLVVTNVRGLASSINVDYTALQS